MKNYKIGFIGAGNIASAIIQGILSSGYIIPKNIYVYDIDDNKKNRFFDSGVNAADNPSELAKCVDYIFLTVKPQIYPDVLNEIKDIAFNKCVIDVAAGITIDYVKSFIGKNTSVIRVMPNTPLTIGHGSTAIVREQPVTDEQFSFVKGIFESSGVTVTVDEKFINVVTAINGSAPAFILQFAKCIIDYGVSCGIEKSDAEKMVLNTVIGSGILALKSTDDIANLIENVTSKGGTTAAGREVLDRSDFENIIIQCLDKTLERANELTK